MFDYFTKSLVVNLEKLSVDSIIYLCRESNYFSFIPPRLL